MAFIPTAYTVLNLIFEGPDKQFYFASHYLPILQMRPSPIVTQRYISVSPSTAMMQ